MESKAKEKVLLSMDIKDKDDWIEVRAEAIYNAIDMALQEMKRENASNLQLALKEQAKEIKARLEQEANLTINKIYSTKREKSKKELQYRIAISNWIKFWEKYGVKEEGK